MVRTLAFKSYSNVIGFSFRSLSPSSIAIFNSLHPEPERILDDAQADLASKRHQRFRVKLHAANRQGLVLDRHRDAVLGAGRDLEHFGHAVALDIERMITADHDFIGQVLHQPPAADLDPRRPSMRRLPKLAGLAAEIFPDRLHAEANAEDRQLPVERSPNGFGNPEIFWPPRPWRQHQQIVALAAQHLLGVNIAYH